MTKLLYKIRDEIGKVPLTEMDAAMLIDDMRKEIPGYLDLSFETTLPITQTQPWLTMRPDKENQRPPFSFRLSSGGFRSPVSGGNHRCDKDNCYW
jgi:hypothetical protein